MSRVTSIILTAFLEPEEVINDLSMRLGTKVRDATIASTGGKPVQMNVFLLGFNYLDPEKLIGAVRGTA